MWTTPFGNWRRYIVADLATALPGRAPWMESRETALEVLVLSFLPVFVIASGFAAFSPQCAHWFLIPVVFCGTLTSMDAWEWLRGRLDLMDPIGLMGVVGFHFFFLAPLLHVAWDYWMGSTAPPADWRDWLCAIGAFHAVRLVAHRVFSRTPPHTLLRKPKIDLEIIPGPCERVAAF